VSERPKPKITFDHFTYKKSSSFDNMHSIASQLLTIIFTHTGT